MAKQGAAAGSGAMQAAGGAEQEPAAGEPAAEPQRTLWDAVEEAGAPSREREGRQVGPEVGPTSAFYSCVPTGMHGPTCIFWANLTAFSLRATLHSSFISPFVIAKPFRSSETSIGICL